MGEGGDVDGLLNQQFHLDAQLSLYHSIQGQMKLNNGCSTLCAHCHNICFICGSLCFEEYLTGNVIGSSVGKVFISAVCILRFPASSLEVSNKEPTMV